MKLFTSAILAACASAETERFMTQAFTNCEHAHLATENTDVGGASCPKNKVIRVMAASYGRNDDNTCHGGNFYDSYPECSLDVTHHAAADCDGKRSCNYNANNKEIADPCVGTHKYTKVKKIIFQQKKFFLKKDFFEMNWFLTPKIKLKSGLAKRS
jgi:hypothetical protein